MIRLQNATCERNGRVVWKNLNLDVHSGELVAVLGPNGSGKSSLLKALLGLVPLASGTAEVGGLAPEAGRRMCGYVPQQRGSWADAPIRGRDLVRLGLDGHGFGLGLESARSRRLVAAAIREVEAQDFADAPMGQLSGGEQQRLRIAQALVSDPQVLLCDEPLLSLDLAHQQAVTELIGRRRSEGAAVLFVTHEVNPILPLVDRILYLVNGRWAVGRPDEVLTTERLTELYGAPVDVLNVRGRVVVVGAGEAILAEAGGHHSERHE